MTEVTNKRSVKTVSFAANDFERGLLEHATDPAHGTFSQYVKRLIDRDREGVTAVKAVAHVEPVAPRQVISEKDREASRSFL